MPRRRGTTRSRAVRDDSPGTPATVLLAAAGLAGVLVGSTLHAGTGTAVMAVSALVPSVMLGGALVRARTALAHGSWQRHRMAGDLAVQDLQVRRLADRLDLLADQGLADAAELERTSRQLRRARVEIATTRAVVAGVREDAARSRAAAALATTERDAARADLAGAAAAATTRETAVAVAAALRAVEADVARTRLAVAAPRVVSPRVAGRRSFASVDLRVFDAFTEADLAEEDAVLDAPVRRGRHAAAAALTGDLDLVLTTAPTVPVAAGAPAARSGEPALRAGGPAAPERVVA